MGVSVQFGIVSSVPLREYCNSTDSYRTFTIVIAIDIVLGGPPCVDYSLANAQRQGVSGLQGSYMIRFGNLVTKIRHMQRDHHVYFLAENVRIDNEKELPLDAGQLTAIEKAFGVSWNFKLDAKLYSPLRRLRMFFTNITADVAEYYEMKDKPVHQCLEDDFNHCACIDGHEPRARHNCFMAHQGRVNDDRMIVYKRDGNGMIERRFLSVTEREAMMGYPKGYVKNPGKFLSLVTLC